MFYKISVRKRKELLSRIIDQIPNEGKISFEGTFLGKIKPKLIPSQSGNGILTRTTYFPIQDFWIFELNQQTKEYIKKDLLNSIGLRNNVVHVQIEVDSQLLFVSNDGFDVDGVSLTEMQSINLDFLQILKSDGIIWDFKITEVF